MSAILETRGLRKAFGGVVVCDGISMELRAGERVALIGPNGAGKTSFVNLVSGDLRPDSGEVLLDGECVTGLGMAARARKGLVRSFQISRLFQDMTPTEHVALAILQRQGRSGRMTGTFRDMPYVMAETDAILQRLGLDSLPDRKVSEVAYGQKRLLELGIALALRPKVLLLDEPAAGLPQSERGRVVEAVAALPQDLAVLMIDHDMDLVFRFAQRIIVLAAGAVIFDGTPEHAAQDRKVRQAYLGD